MIKLNIGGVPEHFNMPWQLLLNSKTFSDQGIAANWTDFQGGTGAMGQALDDGDLDIGILLTEGAIQGIDKGKKYKIISFYVDSPLTWGIHVPASSSFQKIEELKAKRYAISRFGSGSHLMAMFDAKERGWDYQNLDFIEVESLQGARDSFQKGESDIFFWEKYTTKSLVDSGEFKRIAERRTPFSCFVICASDRAIEEKGAEILMMVAQLFKSVATLSSNSRKSQIISDYYKLSCDDVDSWLREMVWAERPHLSTHELNSALCILKDLGLIHDGLTIENVCNANFL